MTNPNQLQDILGRTAVDPNGDKVGKIGQIYVDDRTGQPVWATVSTGLFGTKQSFAPLHGSRVEGDTLVLAVDKDLVKAAPSIDADGHTSDEDNDALYQHYSSYLDTQTQPAGSGEVHDVEVHDPEVHGVEVHGVDAADNGGRREDLADRAGAQGRDTSGPSTDEAMTRSEERLRVGTEQVEAGRARLRKYIVTEDVTTTVPVSHEEVRIEREPITDANRDQALAGGELTEEVHEVTLHAERPVVDKETVPVERVRLATDTVTEEQQVTEQVRKEQIEQVSDADPRDRQ